MAIPFLVGDVYQLAVYCRSQDQQNQVNVLHYRVKEITGTGADFQTMLDSASSDLATHYKANLPASARYNGVIARDLVPPLTSSFFSIAGAGVGTLIGDPLAPQLAPLISWRSAGAPAGTRGRSYMPSPDESYEHSNGRLTAGAITAYTSLATGIKELSTLASGPSTTSTLELVIRTGLTLPYSIHLVSSFLVRPAFATQRRRSLINRADINPL